MGARRVVRGDDHGKSVIVEDSKLSRFSLGSPMLEPLWASPTTPSVPNDGAIDFSGPFFPPAGAIRSFRAVFCPAGAEDDFGPEALAEIEASAPGALAYLEPDHPGMHTTHTVDIGIVQSGEVWLELDDGEEVLLRSGDYVVQNGTRHAWHNRADKECVMTFVVIGANRSSP